MFAAIAQSAPIAVGIIFSSIPLVAVTLALLTRPHKTAVLAFLLGWMAGITLVGSLVLLLADGSSRDAQATPGWLAWARIAIGGLLLALAQGVLGEDTLGTVKFSEADLADLLAPLAVAE